ncbi:MAG: hypothetical protein P4N60_02755 [Verrucomicrobiae bacterium]|nr:hypothetical protein [Verrucomicrobiae bacterium]
MTSALAILSAAVFLTTGLVVFACVVLAARADRLMQRLPLGSDFEEA